MTSMGATPSAPVGGGPGLMGGVPAELLLRALRLALLGLRSRPTACRTDGDSPDPQTTKTKRASSQGPTGDFSSFTGR